MARYNHFGKIKHTRVEFNTLAMGDKFSSRDVPFLINIKTGPLEYLVKRTNETITLFSDKALFYIK